MNLPEAMAKDGVNMLFGEKTTLTQGALQEVKLAAGVTLAEQIDANYIRSNIFLVYYKQRMKKEDILEMHSLVKKIWKNK